MVECLTVKQAQNSRDVVRIKLLFNCVKRLPCIQKGQKKQQARERQRNIESSHQIRSTGVISAWCKGLFY